MSGIKKIFTSRLDKDGIFFKRMYAILGFKPKNLGYYEKAFTHRSLNLKKKKMEAHLIMNGWNF